MYSFSPKTQAKLRSGDIISALVINFSLGGSQGNPIAFTEQLRYDGNENGLPKFSKEFFRFGYGDLPSTHHGTWEPYNNDNWIVIGIMPERAKSTEDKSSWAWKNILKIEEVPRQDFED